MLQIRLKSSTGKSYHNRSETSNSRVYSDSVLVTKWLMGIRLPLPYLGVETGIFGKLYGSGCLKQVEFKQFSLLDRSALKPFFSHETIISFPS